MQTLQLQYLLKRPKILRTTTTTTSFVYPAGCTDTPCCRSWVCGQTSWSCGPTWSLRGIDAPSRNSSRRKTGLVPDDWNLSVQQVANWPSAERMFPASTGAKVQTLAIVFIQFSLLVFCLFQWCLRGVAVTPKKGEETNLQRIINSGRRHTKHTLIQGHQSE